MLRCCVFICFQTTTATKLSPRVPAAPKPKLPSTTASKPRVPLSKTVAKTAPDTEKQIKESANKITASKSASGAITNRVTASSNIRKIESKVRVKLI